MPIRAMIPTELMAIKAVISFSVRTRSCSNSYPFIGPIYLQVYFRLTLNKARAPIISRKTGAT
jgi:hypothetical protein